jgi:hypothetical protein
MGYKLLGFVVWQGARLYLRRRVSGTKGKMAVAGLSVAVLVGALAVGRKQTAGNNQP